MIKSDAASHFFRSGYKWVRRKVNWQIILLALLHFRYRNIASLTNHDPSTHRNHITRSVLIQHLAFCSNLTISVFQIKPH